MNIFKRGGDEDVAYNDSQVEYSEGVEIHTAHEDNGSHTSTGLEKYSFRVLLITLFLLPILFIPSISIPFQMTKVFLVFIGVLLALLLTLVARLKEGRLTVPFHTILCALWALPMVYFISTLFSTNPHISFLGHALESDTFAFILLMAVLVTLVVMIMRKKEQILTSYLVLFLSFIILFVFQGLRLFFGTDFLSFNTLLLTTSNVLGKWNDLSIYFGLATILSLVTLASLQLSESYKKVLYVILLVSLFFLAVVNFTLTWFIVGLFALGFLVHSVGIKTFNWKKAQPLALHEQEEGQDVEEEVTQPKIIKNISIASAIVFVASLLFVGSGFLNNDPLGLSIANTFGISQIEARPSWKSTLKIAKNSYEDNAFFGPGPNMFINEWVTSRPVELNNTIFWNADFVSGIGIIPTAFVSVGLIGGFAWVVLFILFVYSGFRSLVLNSGENRFSYYITLSSFLAGLYLWLMLIFYTPNVVLITLAFFFLGTYIASLRHNSVGTLRERTYVFAGNPKTGFAAVFVLTFLLLATLVSGFTVYKVYNSGVKFQQGVIALNVAGDIDLAQNTIVASALLHQTDRQYRLLTNIFTARVISLQSETNLSEEELAQSFQLALAQSIESGKEAVRRGPENYQNWVALGTSYQAVVSLGIDGAYDNALINFEQALVLNPNGPATYLTLARLEVAHRDTLKARDYIASALQLKSNYTEAIFLLSQIEIAEGNVDEAIVSIEAAAVLTRNNPVIYFQLGLLKYNQADYEGARQAFGSAVVLSNDYANALYFLGLTEDKLGNTNDAIVYFVEVERLNPENTEVKSILTNLRNGDAPFNEATQVSAIPESLPVEEPPEGEIVDEGATVLDEVFDEEAGDATPVESEEEPNP